MWVFDLLDANESVTTTVPVVEGIHTLGRKNASFSFPDDRSVSRKHAEVRVGVVAGNDPARQPIWVKDVGSKLKTFVNGVETGEANVEVALADGDTVKLGTTGSVMRLRYQALRFCGTSLTPEEKAELKKLCLRCGGSVARRWEPGGRCTHLVAPAQATTVTEKLVLAVAEARPAVHVGWVRALAEAGTARPLRPVPDTVDHGSAVKRGRGLFPVRPDDSRRTHLSGDFLVALYKEEVIEKMVETTGGSLCRAYAMSDADFAVQNWQEWAAGRKSFFVQPVPGEPLVSKQPEIKAAVESRGATLEGLGIEPTNKQLLAEAVLYLQPLVSVSEAAAMQASSSSAAMAMGVQSEAWGTSQSVASQAPQAPRATHAPRAATPAAAPSTDPAMPPPPGVGGSGSISTRALPKPDAVAAPATASAAADAATSDAPAEPAAAEPSKSAAPGRTKRKTAARADDAGSGGGGAAVAPSKKRGRQEQKEGRDRQEEAGAAAAAAAARAGVLATAAGGGDDGERVNGRDGDNNPGTTTTTTTTEEAATAKDNDAAAAGSAGGNAGAGTRAGAAQKGGGGHDGDAGADSGAAGGGERQDRRKRGARRGRAEEDENGRQEKQREGEEKAEEEEEEEEEEEKQEEDSRRGRGEEGASSSRAAARGGGGGRGNGSAPAPAPAPGGWMTAHNAAPSQKDKRRRGSVAGAAGGGGSQGAGAGRGRGRSGDPGDEVGAEGGGGAGAGGEGEGDEEDKPLETPPQAAVTEKRRLVVRAYSRAATRGYSGVAGGGGAGRGGLPNFKRFKKNTIMYGGEMVDDYVPMSALRSTLPKESERELVLAAEQQRLEEEEADADRLFTGQEKENNARGAKARAPRGRTKRR